MQCQQIILLLSHNVRECSWVTRWRHSVSPEGGVSGPWHFGGVTRGHFHLHEWQALTPAHTGHRGHGTATKPQWQLRGGHTDLGLQLRSDGWARREGEGRERGHVVFGEGTET